MSDTKFTQGNWHVVDRTTNGVKGYEICWSEHGECVTDHVYEKADAHLMAASKELYEALTVAREYIAKVHGSLSGLTGENSIVKPDLDRCDAALAKATEGEG